MTSGSPGPETLADAAIESPRDRVAASDSVESGWRAAYRFFKSLKCGLILLALIAAVCVYGAVGYAANPALGKNQVSLARAQVFQSTWFAALLGVFAIQLLVSTWHVTVMSLTLWKRRDFRRDRDFYDEALAPRVRMRLAAPIAKVRQVLAPGMTYLHEEDGAIFGQSGLASRVGPTIVHAGMLLVLGAGMVRAFLLQQGVVISEGRFIVAEGEAQNLLVQPINRAQMVGGANTDARPLPDGMWIRLLDFDADTHPNVGEPSFFSSLLEIVDPAAGTARVVQVDMNHSLNLHGMNFHQAAYDTVEAESPHRFEYELREAGTGRLIARDDASPGVPARAGRSGLFIEVSAAAPGAKWRLFDARDPLGSTATGTVVAAPKPGSYTFTAGSFVRDAVPEGEDGVREQGGGLRNPALNLRVDRDGATVAQGWLGVAGNTPAIGPPKSFASLPFEVRLEDFTVNPSRPAAELGQPDTAEFLLTLRARESGVVLDQVRVPSAGTSPPVTHAPGTREEAIKSQLPPGTPIVFLHGPTKRHVTVLSVVREPTIPVTTIGVGVILLGAIMTFVTRYRALYGREQDGMLDLLLVPRWGHGREAARRELDSMATRLEAAGLARREEASPT